MPGIIKNGQKTQWITGLKKANALLSQAMQKYMADNNCIANINCMGIFDAPNDLKFYNAIKPYLNIQKDCGGSTTKDCWPDDTKKLNGDLDTIPVTRGDWDTFEFYVTHTGRVIPQGTTLFWPGKEWTSSNTLFNCDPTNTPDAVGASCAGRIIEEGWKMNY